jgi:hypothetical protein
MAIKRTTTEEFDNDGRLRKRVVVEEDDGQLHLIPAYPALPLYPYPAGPAIVPYMPPGTPGPWHEPFQPVITCGEGNGWVNPGNVMTAATPRHQLTATAGGSDFQVN